MSYSLIVTVEASAAVAAMDETAHELFVLAMLDLTGDPHGTGRQLESEGAFTIRTFTLGPLGMIVYVVNDANETVTVTDVFWIG